MEKMVLGPLRHLVYEVDRIRTRKVASQRIVIKGNGELMQLATNINTMLDTLDSFDKKLVTVNKEMESKAIELEANSKELERLNRHMVGRELRMAELKEQLEELEFKLKQKEDAI
jgi:methyl-accepting chemotaxis protein